MSFLVEAFGTILPFNKYLIDIRNSLGFQLGTKYFKFGRIEREE
jgi:hypothetical protein